MKKIIARAKSATFGIALLVMWALVMSACARTSPRIDAATYAKELDAWRAQRVADLKSENGWLTLIGLFWLKGTDTIGSDLKNDIVLPKDKVPPHSGKFLIRKGEVYFETAPENHFTVDGRPLIRSTSFDDGKPVASAILQPDTDPKPTVMRFGSLSFQIIKRGDKLGLRVKDSENPDRAKFQGIESYPADLKWRIEGRFEPYYPPKPMPIINVLGMETDEASPGAVTFELNGKVYRLDAISEQDEPRFFMIFKDPTSGKETYGAGRYLYVNPPDTAGRVIIDFNKAYSPPCAFTNYATCPLPPEQNSLPIAVEAGEKYSGHPK